MARNSPSSDLALRGLSRHGGPDAEPKIEAFGGAGAVRPIAEPPTSCWKTSGLGPLATVCPNLTFEVLRGAQPGDPGPLGKRRAGGGDGPARGSMRWQTDAGAFSTMVRAVNGLGHVKLRTSTVKISRLRLTGA